MTPPVGYEAIVRRARTEIRGPAVTNGEKSAKPRGGAKWRALKVALALGPLVLLGAVYALSPGLREGLDRVVGLLLREEFDAVRDYVLSFGAWALVVSLLLMILQAIIAPIPAFALSVANGLAFGVL